MLGAEIEVQVLGLEAEVRRDEVLDAAADDPAPEKPSVESEGASPAWVVACIASPSK